jgi:DNA-binding Lrp family transcriptional regulator
VPPGGGLTPAFAVRGGGQQDFPPAAANDRIRPKPRVFERSAGGRAMFTAFVMIQAERRRLQDVARRLAEIPGVEEVYSVTGEWDIIAVLRLKDYDGLAEIVTGRMVEIPGIVRTNTHLAFRAFPQSLLERSFSVGLEEQEGEDEESE